jgi:hypothetical protein
MEAIEDSSIAAFEMTLRREELPPNRSAGEKVKRWRRPGEYAASDFNER